MGFLHLLRICDSDEILSSGALHQRIRLDLLFQLAPRVALGGIPTFVARTLGGLSDCGNKEAARRSSAIGNRGGVLSISESSYLLVDL